MRRPDIDEHIPAVRDGRYDLEQDGRDVQELVEVVVACEAPVGRVDGEGRLPLVAEHLRAGALPVRAREVAAEMAR